MCGRAMRMAERDEGLRGSEPWSAFDLLFVAGFLGAGLSLLGLVMLAKHVF